MVSGTDVKEEDPAMEMASISGDSDSDSGVGAQLKQRP